VTLDARVDILKTETREVILVKAILISPVTQSIEPVEIGNLEDVKRLIGFDTLESDAVGTQGDRLYFDEECFLRATPGRFQIDKVVPVAGRGVIVGAADGGLTLQDAATDIDDLRRRTRYV
jgi:hypothetical protein